MKSQRDDHRLTNVLIAIVVRDGPITTQKVIEKLRAEGRTESDASITSNLAYLGKVGRINKVARATYEGP